MSVINNVIDDIIESKLLELHTAFLAKVVAVNGKTYSVKPLAKYKQYGKEAEEYPVISNVYRVKGVSTGKTTSFAHSHTVPSVTTGSNTHSHGYGSGSTTNSDTHSHSVPANTAQTTGSELDVTVQIPINVGDVVLCIALERDMSNLINGESNLPFTGVHHRINDAIILDVVDL